MKFCLCYYFELSMNTYFSDIFYDTQHLDSNERNALVDFIFRDGYRWHLDKLDGYQRKQIKEATKTDVLNALKDVWHFVVIHRRGYTDWQTTPMFNHAWCIEIGFVTDYVYFFGYADESLMPFLVNKFNLVELKNEKNINI